MKIALFTDSFGIVQFEGSQLLNERKIGCLVVASNRPHGHDAAKKFSDLHSIPLLIQPTYNSPMHQVFVQHLKKLDLDHIISSSYSMIIRPEVLELFKGKAINVHWSLLPKNRGPNPIQWTLIKGENQIAVTFHKISEGVDEGAIVYQECIPVEQDDTWVSLMDKLTKLSNRIIRDELKLIIEEIGNAVPQDHSIATVNPRLNSDSPLIDFERMSDHQIFNLIRAQVSPLAGAFFKHGELEIRLPKYIPLRDISEFRQIAKSGNVKGLINKYSAVIKQSN